MIMCRKQTAIAPGIWAHACIVLLSTFPSVEFHESTWWACLRAPRPGSRHA